MDNSQCTMHNSQLKEGYRKTRLGWIPEGWEMRKLEEVCNILDSKRKPIKAKDREKMKGNIPYYGASGIIDWINDYIFDEDIILLGEDGENLKSRNSQLAFKVTGKCWVNNHAHVFKILNANRDDIDYITYYLENKDYTIYIAGSAQPKITQAQCRKLLIATPRIEEQKKISSILSSVDEYIEEVDNMIEDLKELEKGLVQKLLTGEYTIDNGKLVKTKEFKKTRLGMIPEGWEIRKIKDICELGRGRVINKKEIEANPGSYPVFSSQTTDKGCMGYINSYDLEGEYVTWTTDGVNAGSTFYRNGKFNCTNVCGTLKLKTNAIDHRFLALILNKYTDRYVVRTGNSKLMNNIMATIDVPIPSSIVEQGIISDILLSVDERIETYQKKKEDIQKLKKGLMQQLLTGKIRVKVN